MLKAYNFELREQLGHGTQTPLVVDGLASTAQGTYTTKNQPPSQIKTERGYDIGPLPLLSLASPTC